MIGRDAGGEDQPDATAAARQLQRAVEEQLITVRMSAAVVAVAVGGAAIAKRRRRGAFRIGSFGLGADVRTQDVPGRIANHRIEARIARRLPARIKECFRERELPVKG